MDNYVRAATDKKCPVINTLQTSFETDNLYQLDNSSLRLIL